MQVITPLSMKVMRKSGVYKFTEHISQFYHVSMLYYCKTRWLGASSIASEPKWIYILNNKFIIIHYLSVHLRISWPSSPDEANAKRQRKHSVNFHLIFFFFLVALSEQKPTAFSGNRWESEEQHRTWKELSLGALYSLQRHICQAIW